MRREADPADARVRRLVLTDRGHGAVAAARLARADVVAELRERLGARRVGAAERLLRDVLRAMGGRGDGPRAARAPAQLASRPMSLFTSPLAEEIAPDLLDRFQRYVRVDTQSRRDGDGVAEHPGPARPLAHARRGAQGRRPRRTPSSTTTAT